MNLVKTRTTRSNFEYNSSFVVSSDDDDDADYKPMLSGFVNTRCNYDGSKIEGHLED
ncbi:MAG: hypothetical protein ACC612_09170 [Methanomethylovorans sp.]|uniref:hypothetical protein n=1 Tax=Methanomethylovorans sp. TaxID=2758717 RepID=UPI003530573B